MKDDKNKLLSQLLSVNPEIFQFIKKKYHSDELYRMLGDNENCSAQIFRYFENPPIDVINKFINKDGEIIEAINPSIITADMIVRAIYSNPRAILKIPASCGDLVSEEIKELAFDLDPSLMSKFRYIRPEYLEEKISTDPMSIVYIKKPSDKLKCKALRADPNIVLHFNKLSNSMMDIIDECYPGLSDHLPSYTRNNKGAVKDNGGNV